MIASYAGGESGARAAARAGSAVVVVDAFRASTTIAVLVARGARVVPVASIEHARSYAGADLRAGERGSARVAGFDLGNSPVEILDAGVQPGSTVVLSTTNGTRVVEAARGAPAILTGAFVNAGPLADELAAGTCGPRVVVVGCGWEGRRASEWRGRGRGNPPPPAGAGRATGRAGPACHRGVPLPPPGSPAR